MQSDSSKVDQSNINVTLDKMIPKYTSTEEQINTGTKVCGSGSLLRILRPVLILRNAKTKHPSRSNLAPSTAMIMMMD